MNWDEINDRAWTQMQSLSDFEVLHHPLILLNDPPSLTADVWDLRIKLRDLFFNELYEELRGYLNAHTLPGIT
jgi:hypothetical protein